ncbi:MAG TPA: FecR domain-containing protein [Pyrinomonadaceae bacterium]|nr:FecR domain-containing protein [Pyrinomonadaceae bacterium]
MNCRTLSERLIALCTALAVLQLSALLTFGTPLDTAGLKPAGALATYGLTKVDGEIAIHGQTFFSGSTIETAQDATSIVSLGARGRLELLKSSRLRLSFNESSMTCSLDSGRTRIYVPAGVRANVTTKDAAVVSDATSPAAFSVEYRNGDLTVAVLAGRVEMREGNRTEQFWAGQIAFVKGHAPQPQPDEKNEFGRRKTLVVLFSIGGAIALIALIFSNRDDEVPLDFGGCVQILSPTGDNKCPS